MEETILFDAVSTEYSQSANSLFHFMDKASYLEDALINQALTPRYCAENIDYLNIVRNRIKLHEVWIIDKCFCDIPLHQINDTFKIEGIGESYKSLEPEEQQDFLSRNTHPDFYGKYAIAFPKSWGKKQNLQPVHYFNPDSDYIRHYSQILNSAINEESLSEEYATSELERLAFMKPLSGVTSRLYRCKKKPEMMVQCIKNFYDEREWRYIPSEDVLDQLHLNLIIANPRIFQLYEKEKLNDKISGKKYQDLKMSFTYNDVNYIIVPDALSRDNIIKLIMRLPESSFDLDYDRYKLISKILILDEIRRDW